MKSTTIDYTLDGAYRLESESRTIEDGAGNVTNWSEAYEYDEVGNRETKATTVDSSAMLVSYGYNARNQITTETASGVVKYYEYDQNGNTRFVRNAAGDILKEMQYDDLNRMTLWTDGTDTETTTYRGSKWHRSSYTANGNTIPTAGSDTINAENITIIPTAGSDTINAENITIKSLCFLIITIS